MGSAERGHNQGLETLTGKKLIGGRAQGTALASTTALSFWGGVDPATGEVIDRHHPLSGSCVTDKVLAIPSGRGSCSGSGVILELLLNGQSPAALVFEHEESILTLGVIIAHEFFGKSIPVVQMPSLDFVKLAAASYAQIENGKIRCMEIPDNCAPESNDNAAEADVHIPSDFQLSDFDRHVLDGGIGKAAEVAARVVLKMAIIQGANSLIDVSQAHIDGCLYTGPATLLFAQQLCKWGARVRIPATLNSISIDRGRWVVQGIKASLAEPAGQLADAYVEMGARPTYTCAPYLLDSAPASGAQVVWAESNAVVYANSVLGARTMKYPDYLDICIALTGRAPNAGCHIKSNRQARIAISVPPVSNADDALFPLLGYVVGDIAASRIPLVTGLEATPISNDNLKAFGAAFATTSSAPMFHVAGITPEASTAVDQARHLSSSTSTVALAHDDLVMAWRKLDSGASTTVDLVALGNPHASYTELAQLAALCSSCTKSPNVALVVTCGRETYERAASDGFIDTLAAFGAQIITDTCWCMISEPVISPQAKTIMTNSGKYAHYGAGLTGRSMRFGSMEGCVRAACGEEVEKVVPEWLGGGGDDDGR